MRPFRLQLRPLGLRGFSLVELAAVLAILSLVLAIAVPTSARLLNRARARALENDLRVFAQAYQSYAVQQGDWPVGDGVPAAIPAGMEGFLHASNWQRRSPIGGHYAWETNSPHRGYRYRAVIVVAGAQGSPVLGDPAVLQAIDREIDDGELFTGNFFLGYGNQPTFVLER